MGGDRNTARSAGVAPYFNPRLPDGRRPLTTRQTIPPTTFQSTPPGWEATAEGDDAPAPPQISIHASRMGGDPLLVDRVRDEGGISIHASRMGGDRVLLHGSRRVFISIHASRMGGDARGLRTFRSNTRFQSTPPGWETTSCILYPLVKLAISIHASRMGGDSSLF